LATTGILGLLSFLFLGFRVIKERPLFIPLVIFLAVSFILPLSFFDLVLFFFLLGIYASIKGLSNDSRYFDVDLQLVAFRKGFLSFASEGSKAARGYGKALAFGVFGIIAVLGIIFGYLSFDFLSANIQFQKSRIAAAQNNGQLTYTYQSNSLATLTGKHVDSYQRFFSQTNLALATSLAESVPQGTQPSQETTQTIYTLVQQSINAARQATTISPKNALNWQNLSSIYRSLIGFGQNADSFAILAAQQAVQLDPSNPQAYITLGGIYYQLKSWENAKQQFRQAITLKQNYGNAYYNLGHVLQEQGDLEGALAQYQTVKQLVANDPTNLAKIEGEIQALQNQIGKQQEAQTAQSQGQASLTVPTPPATLPKQNPPVKIPAPGTVTNTPTPTKGPTPTP
jgi:tetratricopeptide (TPR) repeat protein